MSIVDAIILGLVQGLTEFLPISSSGHLVIAQYLLGLPTQDVAFDVALHVGTLFSIFTIYFSLLKKVLVKGLLSRDLFKLKNLESRLIFMVLVASVPTAFIGLVFRHQLEAMFSDMKSLGICFILTGVILYLTRFMKSDTTWTKDSLKSLTGVEKITSVKAFLIGTAQGLAIIPSISRSGTTIITGLYLGLPGPTVAMFSFIMSLPAIAGAALLELKDIPLTSARWEIIAIGVFTSYLSGLLGLLTVLKVIRKGRLELFTGYLILLGVWVLWKMA
ncbi:MAG: undecaprenyl-diphosphate phosphatase [Bdellovibrionales bacterium]|nr:undecaprenyl-diphosphate phosphatase [Bdellovibrionales bacterium]